MFVRFAWNSQNDRWPIRIAKKSNWICWRRDRVDNNSRIWNSGNYDPASLADYCSVISLLCAFLFVSWWAICVNLFSRCYKIFSPSPEFLQSYINEHEPILKKCHKLMRQEKLFRLHVDFLVSLIAIADYLLFSCLTRIYSFIVASSWTWKIA